MKFLFALSLLLSSPFAFSQGDSATAQGESPNRPEYLAQGRLLTLRVVPGDRKATLFLAGRQAANIQESPDHRLLEVTAVNSKSQTQTLTFSKEGDAYVVSKLPQWKEPYDLKVKAETRGQVDEMKVRMKNSKP